MPCEVTAGAASVVNRIDSDDDDDDDDDEIVPATPPRSRYVSLFAGAAGESAGAGAATALTAHSTAPLAAVAAEQRQWTCPKAPVAAPTGRGPGVSARQHRPTVTPAARGASALHGAAGGGPATGSVRRATTRRTAPAPREAAAGRSAGANATAALLAHRAAPAAANTTDLAVPRTGGNSSRSSKTPRTGRKAPTPRALSSLSQPARSTPKVARPVAAKGGSLHEFKEPVAKQRADAAGGKKDPPVSAQPRQWACPRCTLHNDLAEQVGKQQHARHCWRRCRTVNPPSCHRRTPIRARAELQGRRETAL